jgi:hypothetical protein
MTKTKEMTAAETNLLVEALEHWLEAYTAAVRLERRVARQQRTLDREAAEREVR